MLILFVTSRFYSNTLIKVARLFSIKKRRLYKINQYLLYPPDVDSYVKQYQSHFSYDLASKSIVSKKFVKSLSYLELVSLHKFFNTTLEINSAIITFHEILRRNCQIKILFSPYGVRRFLASQILLGGLRVQTNLNFKFGKFLVKLLGMVCAFSYSNQFNSFVSNKTVSLCGGAPSPSDNRNDIDESDLVIRLNRHLSNGDRMDIVYFRSEKLNHMHKSGVLAQMPKFEFWSSLKTFKHYARLRYFGGNAKNVAATISLDSAFDLGKLNAIPTVCLDLLSKSCGKIKVFDTDLNLSKKHKVGYRSEGQPKVEFNLIFGEHPSYVQFCTLKYLYKLGLIEFEYNPNFNINWSYTEFIKQFKNVYSNS